MEKLVYLLIFLIPAYLIRFTVFGIPTNMLEALTGTVCTLWIAASSKSLIAHFKITIQTVILFVIGNRLLVIGSALLFLGLIGGMFVSSDIKTSLGVLKGWFVFPFLLFILMRSLVDTQAKKEKALWILALSGASVACIALVYWVRGEVTFDGRLTAFYESPNMLAMYIAPAILILSRGFISTFNIQGPKAQLKIKQYFAFQPFLIVSLALLVFSLLLTRSLSVPLALIGALFYIRFSNYLTKRGYQIFFGAIIIGGLLLPLASFFIDPWELGRNSLASRAMIWQSAWLLLKDHWLFGIGPGMFQEAYLANQADVPPYLEWAVPHPHNIFLTAWLYGGLAGLIGFILVLCWLFAQARNSKKTPIRAIAMGVLCAIMIYGFIDNSYWRNDAATVFWLVAALM